MRVKGTEAGPRGSRGLRKSSVVVAGVGGGGVPAGRQLTCRLGVRENRSGGSGYGRKSRNGVGVALGRSRG